VGAGTVEFIMDEDGSYYFMEMNTRLQVEHPVTEMITGQDLVEWQIKVASGRPLPMEQSDLRINGHSFEARIYAENPFAGFLPTTGTLSHLTTPAPSDTVRIESGVVSGDEVSVYYDPMIAKLVVWDVDREAALRKLKRCLDQYKVGGVQTNIPFLHNVASHQAFVDADLETHFIENFKDELLPVKEVDPTSVAIGVLSHMIKEKYSLEEAPADPHSPFQDPTLHNFRTSPTTHEQSLSLIIDDENVDVNVATLDGGFSYAVHIPGVDEGIEISGDFNEDEMLIAQVGNEVIKAQIAFDDEKIHVFRDGANNDLTITVPQKTFGDAAGSEGSLQSPMPGKIVSVMVNPGDQVEKGQALLVLEAMKMEHTIRAPAAQTIDSIFYNVGDLVEEKKALVSFVEE